MTVTRYQGSSVQSYQGTTSSALGRLVILHEIDDTGGFVGEVQALFNPGRLEFSAGSTVKAPGSVAPDAALADDRADYVFQRTTLRIDLLFDTSEQTGDGANVLEHTTRVVALAHPLAKTRRPPRCQLWWGRYVLLQGVLSGVSQSYPLFRPDGTPVRATLGCTFTELDRGEQQLARRAATVARLRVVCLGDTLQRIAAEVYGDARRWRDIALLNDISNPRALVPGRVLRLPT